MANRLWNFVTAMATMPGRQSKIEALLEVNLARQALGRDPLAALPKGECKKPGGCPVSRALDAYVGVAGVCVGSKREARILAAAWGTTWTPRDNGTYVATLPASLRGFVRDFDLGAYPELTFATPKSEPVPEFPSAYRFNIPAAPVYAP